MRNLKTGNMTDPDNTLDKINRVLLDCLHRDPSRIDSISSADFSESDWQVFTDRAIKQKVSALVFYRLKAKGLLSALPENIRNRFQQRYLGNAARNLRSGFHLKVLLNALAEERVRVIVLKGMHLAHTVYPNTSVREMSDVDILVPRERVEEADQVLKGLGYVQSRPFDFSFELNNFKHLPSYLKTNAPAIELHCSILRPTDGRVIDPSQVFACAEPFQMEGLSAYGLSPELLLVHICIHSVYDHAFAFGLQPCCDIAAIISRYEGALDWESVLDTVLRLEAERGVYLALYLAKALLGVKVPSEILDRLTPPPLNSKIVEVVESEVFGGNPLKGYRRIANSTFMKKGALRKATGMIGRVFISKDLLARKYGLRPDSLIPYFYYPIRFKDLIRDHKDSVLKFASGDEHTRSLVEEVAVLERWLEGRDEK